MARERVKLTEQEERILIQAQLMGLSTASMVKIGNRLKALERERDIKRDIDETVSGLTYKSSVVKDCTWEITDSDGLVYMFSNRTTQYSRNWDNTKEVFYDVTVDKPGTRYKQRVAKGQKIYINSDYPAKFCPAKSKELYAIMRGIKRSSWKMV